MTTTDRDVARRRRWWIVRNGGAQVALLLIAAACIWISKGAVAGVLCLLVVFNVAIAYSMVLTTYRAGYWAGRCDVHYERTLRSVGMHPISCARAQPWNADPTDDVDADLAALLRGQGPRP